MKKKILVLGTVIVTLPLYAATPIDLATQPTSYLLKTRLNRATTTPAIQEISRDADLNKTLHVRIRQQYQGIPVMGADGIIHYPQQQNNQQLFKSQDDSKTTMNGTIYEDLQQDLLRSASDVYTPMNELKAKQAAISSFKRKSDAAIPQEISVHPLVFIDKNNEAHWAYKISFLVESAKKLMAPTYILDAENQNEYQYFNNIRTFRTVLAGGYAGNHKTQQKELDGLAHHLPAFTVERNTKTNICYMQNVHTHLIDARTNQTMQFACNKKDPRHNNVYWNANHDQVATTWSPSNDVIFGIQIATNMFQEWYQLPILVKNQKPMKIEAIVHRSLDDAVFVPDQENFIFGDSNSSEVFNPFTQLDTVVHELAHGFTFQHSDLASFGQAEAINESFSDIAGIAAEYYLYGKTDFLVGLGDIKAIGLPLRYMDKPSKDCGTVQPIYACSIDRVQQYHGGLDPHFGGGIFNRFFYELAHKKGWDVKKAFDVMIQANRFYWTPMTTFEQAACGVMKATQDYHYNKSAVSDAFWVVGIHTQKC